MPAVEDLFVQQRLHRPDAVRLQPATPPPHRVMFRAVVAAVVVEEEAVMLRLLRQAAAVPTNEWRFASLASLTSSIEHRPQGDR